MSATDIPVPKGWERRAGRHGDEIIFRPIRARGFPVALIFNLLLMLFFDYQIAGFLKNWFIDKAEMLPAGIVFFLLMCGGMLFVVRNFRLLFRTVQYRIGDSTVQIIERRLGGSELSRTFDKQCIKKVIRTYTPPRGDERNPIWGTLIACRTADGRDEQVALEGYGEDESKFLSQILSSWAAVPTEIENTSA